MFGNLAAFVNGNMFTGLYGDEIFLRVPQEDQPGLLEQTGASIFAPMMGRPLKDYIVIPRSFLTNPEKITDWVTRSLEWSLTLPAKAKTKQRTKRIQRAKKT
jgi:TfoX/Sxy family transcriptional regulator of competence genes